MIELEYIHPSRIQPVTPLGSLAKAFETALMSVDIEPCLNNDDTGEIESAMGDAIYEYGLIGLNLRAIIGRLIHHL